MIFRVWKAGDSEQTLSRKLGPTESDAEAVELFLDALSEHDKVHLGGHVVIFTRQVERDKPFPIRAHLVEQVVTRRFHVRNTYTLQESKG